MIDSGLLAGVSSRDPDRTLFHRVVAIQIGLPITVLDRSALSLMDDACALLLQPSSQSFGEFCVTSTQDLEQCLWVANAIGLQHLTPVNHYPHPLYRRMKDHVPVRVFECLHILRQLQDLAPGEVRRSTYILEKSNFETFTFWSGDEVVIVGPIFTQDRVGDGIARPHYALMQAELERFNSGVRRFWASGDPPIGGERALYTVDYLRNVSFQRDRKLYSLIKARVGFIQRALSRFDDVAATCLGLRTSPRALVKAVAAMEAVDSSGAAGVFLTKGFDGDAPVSIPISVDVTQLAVARERPQVGEAFETAYALNMEAAFQNWSSLTGESLARLRTWLLSEPLDGEGAGVSERQPDYGRRLARFLASTFDAYEATVYAVSYQGGAAQLSVFGAFSGDPSGDERLKAMDRHMKAVVGTVREAESISFRCMHENAVQYCQSYDYATRMAVPRGQRITYPTESAFDFWGRSACAIPIRVNGILWGVLQLIGRRPHAFPEFIRARIEEACSIIGSHLFLNGLVGSVHDITRIISGPDKGNGDKKRDVEACLAKIFGSKTFAIIRSELGDGETSNVFLQRGREDLAQAALKGDDPSYFAPFTAFSKMETRSWQGRVGDDEFRKLFATSHRKKFYAGADGDFVYLRKIAWDFGTTAASPGVIMLTFPHWLGDQEGWRKPIDFACQFVATITGSLYSSDSWEKELREKIGHELSKTATNLMESVKRLERVERRDPGTTASGDHELSLVRGDLNRHARALERYTDILTTDRDVSDFDTDPRLYVIKELWTKWRADPRRKPAGLRELYNTFFFGKLAAFSEKKIEVPRLDARLDLHVKIDEIALGEVLATLAENILKYTLPGTGLTVRDDSSSRNVGLTISNIGLRLDEDERLKIFWDNVRGARAIQHLPSQGSGFGLFFARQTMLRWDCGLMHNQREPGPNLSFPPGQEGQWAWQDFTLKFPRYLVS